MTIRDRNSSELYDVCKFCLDFWEEDKSKSCRTPCSCASYINQDYVALTEITIGLPTSRPWDQTLVPKGAPKFLETISEEGMSKIVEKHADLMKILSPTLQRVLTLLLQNSTRDEICKELDIGEKTYYKYLDRIRAAASSLGHDGQE